jgi:hypothetical protein
MTRRLVVPTVAGAMVMLAALKASLAVCGFGATWRWIRTRAERTPVTADPDGATVARVEYVVAMAAALYPGEAACLQRSLLLYWYLRGSGVAVRYRMGVQMYPFLAHAWVEHRGEPINDVPEHVRLFRPIQEIGG